MKVTRVVCYYRNKSNEKALAVCSVILDDCLRLNDVSLLRGEDGYFLVFPSRQDVYREVESLNKGIKVAFPENHLVSNKTKAKKYEEFYHPLDKGMYQDILKAVVEAYKKES